MRKNKKLRKQKFISHLFIYNFDEQFPLYLVLILFALLEREKEKNVIFTWVRIKGVKRKKNQDC